MPLLPIVVLFTLMVMGKTLPDFDPLVNTNLGTLRGELISFSPKHLSRRGFVQVFRGIPYARPPVGQRRFRLPEAVQPWESELNATMVPPSCPQIVPPFYKHLNTGFGFSEDCLYLNVFVPLNVVSTHIEKHDNGVSATGPSISSRCVMKSSHT